MVEGYPWDATTSSGGMGRGRKATEASFLSPPSARGPRSWLAFFHMNEWMKVDTFKCM